MDDFKKQIDELSKEADENEEIKGFLSQIPDFDERLEAEIKEVEKGVVFLKKQDSIFSKKLKYLCSKGFVKCTDKKPRFLNYFAADSYRYSNKYIIVKSVLGFITGFEIITLEKINGKVKIKSIEDFGDGYILPKKLDPDKDMVLIDHFNDMDSSPVNYIFMRGQHLLDPLQKQLDILINKPDLNN